VAPTPAPLVLRLLVDLVATVAAALVLMVAELPVALRVVVMVVSVISL
jgi:hypothetical protein